MSAGTGAGRQLRVNIRGSRSAATVKRTIKYLVVCTDPRACRTVIRAAPDSVIRAISDAAYNVEQGDIELSPAQKAFFRKHQHIVATLTCPQIGIQRKRRIIMQKGGFPFLPILIGSALGALGSRLFGGAASSSQ
jgi:hypothetical protein